MRWTFGNIHGEISTMPGCTQIGVSHAVFTREKGSGKAVEANARRLSAMYDTGYDYAMCTVDVQNEVQKAILRKNGWHCLDTFLSSKTGHTVCIYGKHLGCS